MATGGRHTHHERRISGIESNRLREGRKETTIDWIRLKRGRGRGWGNRPKGRQKGEEKGYLCIIWETERDSIHQYNEK